MKRNLVVLSFVFVCIFFTYTNCNGKNAQSFESNDTESLNVTPRTITKISALYYNYILQNNKLIKPEDLKKKIPKFERESKGILDAAITDPTRLAKIYSLLNSLQPSVQQSPVDARIVMTINYSDGTKDFLCIGGKYTNRIFLNGVQQAANNKFLFIAKNYIGFYPWLIGDNMFHLPEMKDNSFMKEPFVSTQYYKEYQKALLSSSSK